MTARLHAYHVLFEISRVADFKLQAETVGVIVTAFSAADAAIQATHLANDEKWQMECAAYPIWYGRNGGKLTVVRVHPAGVMCEDPNAINSRRCEGPKAHVEGHKR